MKLLQLQKRNMTWAGLIFTAYLLFHMLTNLSFFVSGRFSAFYHLYNSVYIRWPVLLIVMVSILAHVRTAIRIRHHNARARSIDYKKHDVWHVPSSLVSLSITLLFAFIVFHVWQTLNMDTARLYQDITQLFHSEPMLIIYLVGLSIMALHMQHALRNVLQTLGISSRTYSALVTIAVIILSVGFASVPLSIYLGWV